MIGEKKRGNKKGQVTLFIIIAIIVVALAVFLYLLLKNPTPNPVVTQNPSAYIQTCMQDEIEETVNTLSLQGGSINPSNGYYFYGNNTVEYLCYTNQYYEACAIQQPMLLQHIKNEILSNIKEKTVSCFNDMKKDYEQKGYTASMKTGETTIDLLPDRIVTNFGYEVTLTKGETNKYENFQIILPRDTYRFAAIANSIIQWESIYGDAEVTTYMNYYHDLKVEKQKQLDETSIYILTNRDTDEKFQFASRSYAFPPGVIA